MRAGEGNLPADLPRPHLVPWLAIVGQMAVVEEGGDSTRARGIRRAILSDRGMLSINSRDLALIGARHAVDGGMRGCRYRGG